MKATVVLPVLLLIHSMLNSDGKTSITSGEERSTADILTKRAKLNNRPCIGIIAQKVTSEYTPEVQKYDTYIAASYVKWLELAGAEVVPILPHYSKTLVEMLLLSINGVLFPGGAASMFDSGYYKTARLIFQMAKDANDNGIYFPIWATCLGFETLHNIVNDDVSVLDDFDAVNMSVTLNLTIDAFKSRMFESMPLKLMRSLMENPTAYHFHDEGVSPKTYRKNKKLKNFFKILSTNVARNGKEFVSTVEGIDYPFYGSQWHPEKNIFEWTLDETIDHSPNSIMISQHLANFFVGEARKNKRDFGLKKDADKHTMFKYSPVYSGRHSHFEQVYVFGEKESNNKTLTSIKPKKSSKDSLVDDGGPP